MNAARVLAEPYGHAQLLMEAMLQKNGKGRDKLEKNFQDCKILARTTQLLNEIQTMDPEVATDERFDRCRQGCEQVQKVLEDQDAGLGDRFRFELEEQRKKVERFLTTGVDQDVEEKAEAAAKAVADAEAKAAADAKAVADAEAKAAADAKAVVDAEAKAEAEAKDKAKAPQQSYVLTNADTRWSAQQSHALTSGKHDLERNGIEFEKVSAAVEALRNRDSTIPDDVFKEGYCIVFHKEKQEHYLIFRSDVVKVVEEKFSFDAGAELRALSK
jgi:membrane protein involved in colicin uptake